jgi:hypothetical protein
MRFFFAQTAWRNGASILGEPGECPVGNAVVFRFGAISELRYPKHVPEPGERLMRGGEEWEVVAVTSSGEGKSICVLHRVLMAPELAPDLLERVRSELDSAAWNLPPPRST